MDNKILASELLLNVLERATWSDERVFLTKREIEALALLLNVEGGAVRGASPVTATEAVGVHLNKIAVYDSEITDSIMVCVDFGTAFSKALASVHKGIDQLELIDLPIGDGSTGSTLTTPSELLIDGDQILFGSHARKQLEDTQASPDRLIDSIKQFITLNSDVSLLGKSKLSASQDPTQRFSRRDILVLYLAHLMHLTEAALAAKGLSINVRRRFAHPAWKSMNKDKNEKEMRQMMAEAILLARSANTFGNRISIGDARALLDQLRLAPPESMPLNLMHDPVREATAAGAGALLATEESTRQIILVVDVGAGTTDVAGFICVNNPNWDRARIFEIGSAGDAKNMAGNVLDTALQKLILEKSALVPDSEEFRAAAMAIRRDRRLYKEQLFKTGWVVVALPTDENVTVTLKEFHEFAPVQTFSKEIRDMVSRSAILAAGDTKRINLVATGGGATLPIITELARDGVTYEGKHVEFTLRDSVPTRVRETNPELIEPYPQIAVAVGGALPELPSLYREVSATPTHVPKPAGLPPSYKKGWEGSNA